MNRPTRFVLTVFFLTALGCSRVTDIGAVTRSPMDYRDKTVKVRGTVQETVKVPFVERSLYRLEDKTGEIWVLGRTDPPSRNEKRTVKGSVQPGITVGTRTFGVLLTEEDAR